MQQTKVQMNQKYDAENDCVDIEIISKNGNKFHMSLFNNGKSAMIFDHYDCKEFDFGFGTKLKVVITKGQSKKGRYIKLIKNP